MRRLHRGGELIVRRLLHLKDRAGRAARRVAAPGRDRASGRRHLERHRPARDRRARQIRHLRLKRMPPLLGAVVVDGDAVFGEGQAVELAGDLPARLASQVLRGRRQRRHRSTGHVALAAEQAAGGVLQAHDDEKQRGRMAGRYRRPVRDRRRLPELVEGRQIRHVGGLARFPPVRPTADGGWDAMDVKHRMRRVVAVLIALLVVSAGAARADVKTNEKTHVEFGGTLGRMVKMFGGKAAREGVETSVAVKGDRQMSTTGDTAHLIDLAEEKIYDLDLRHRTYRVTTFAELRRQMEEDRKRAEENASKDRASSSREPRKEYEADFDAKDTGQRKTINGFACREVIATVTVREKGKTLEEGGGIVLTDDLWLTPGVAAMQEVAAFNIRYFKQIAGPYAAGVPAGQMAMAAGMFPGLAEAFAELNSEHVNVDGTPIVSD
ncbi:MAG TPA: hypothetical protein VNE16_13420, partial [Vicinamibacterales bacterium]|nr:hypothetical protein [Vicinamibacterales bacterium]